MVDCGDDGFRSCHCIYSVRELMLKEESRYSAATLKKEGVQVDSVELRRRLLIGVTHFGAPRPQFHRKISMTHWFSYETAAKSFDVRFPMFSDERCTFLPLKFWNLFSTARYKLARSSIIWTLMCKNFCGKASLGGFIFAIVEFWCLGVLACCGIDLRSSSMCQIYSAILNSRIQISFLVLQCLICLFFSHGRCNPPRCCHWFLGTRRNSRTICCEKRTE